MLCLLNTPLLSCVVCPMIYDFWLPLWYIVLYVLWSMSSDYPFGILCCMSYDLCLLITLWYLVSSVLWFMPSDYPFGILCCLSYDLCLLITLWYLVLSVLWFMSSDYPFGILCCLSYYLCPLITPLISCKGVFRRQIIEHTTQDTKGVIRCRNS
jgi:uncharacterized protein (DUF3820 family)